MGAAGAATAGTGTAGNSTAGTGAAGASSITFSDDFSGNAVGDVPANWDTLVYDYNPQSGQWGTQVDSSSQMLVRVSSDHFHGSAPSVLLGSTDADFNVSQITRPIPRGKSVYVAFWMYSKRRIGGQTDPGYVDATIVALRQKSGMTSSELRFGEMNGVLGVHLVPANVVDVEGGSSAYFQGGMPYYWPNTWQCVEVGFIAGGTAANPDKVVFTAGSTQQYTLAPVDIGSSADSWVTAIVNAPGPEIALGWESSNTGLAANDVWIDDVVIGDSWVTCP